MKYYIADVHFGHRNILRFENRPFETVEEIEEQKLEPVAREGYTVVEWGGSEF